MAQKISLNWVLELLAIATAKVMSKMDAEYVAHYGFVPGQIQWILVKFPFVPRANSVGISKEALHLTIENVDCLKYLKYINKNVDKT